MTDREFLWWIHERLVVVHKEHDLYDYMHHLRAIIKDMNKKAETANVARCDTDRDEMKKEFARD